MRHPCQLPGYLPYAVIRQLFSQNISLEFIPMTLLPAFSSIKSFPKLDDEKKFKFIQLLIFSKWMTTFQAYPLFHIEKVNAVGNGFDEQIIGQRCEFYNRQ